MPCPHEPRNLYELNTRVWLRDLGVTRLREVPDAALDAVAEDGFSLVWLMGVWAPSAAAEQAARAHPELRREARTALDDLRDEDIVASPYAIARYQVSPLLGGEADLLEIRARLERRGVGLILDFVPNHTAQDHPFVADHPERYVRAPAGRGSAAETFAAPGGARIYCGRDPYFAPWTDTAQLDHRSAGTRAAMTRELQAVARLCDGVRCDMAMLVLSEVFARTWDRPDIAPVADAASGEFWAEAIDAVRAERRGFLFMAEAYWGTEPRLHRLGFDLTYDKVLYDELVAGRAAGVMAHLRASGGAERHAVRFLENHDEERAAHRLDPALHQVAALVAMTLPGVRLFHQGQLEGVRRKIPVQLARRPREPDDPVLTPFYRELLAILRDPVLLAGRWQLLEPSPAWPGNPSHEAFVAYAWDGSMLGAAGDGRHRLLVANLAPHAAQCRLRIDLPGIAGRELSISEIFAAGDTPAGDASLAGRPVYSRSGDALASEGLFLELGGRTAQFLRF